MRSDIAKSPERGALAGKRALVAERLLKAATQPREGPLSYAQQRLWFLDQLAPNSPLYNIAARACLDGPINVGALQNALNCVVARHETLRTHFRCPDGIPLQTVDAQRECQIGIIDLSPLPESERESETTQQIREELNRPFDLASDQPLRVKLIKLGPEQHQLILVVHHIAADEWSLKILFKEWEAFYAGELEGKHPALPALPIQYADFARWQREWLQGSTLDEHLRYWKNQLRDFPPATGLLTDHPHPGVPTFNGKTASLSLGLALTGQLKELAKKEEATLFMVLLAAFKTLVFRYTQQEDLIVCSPVVGRSRVETEGLIGVFVNTLPLRTSLSGDPSFTQFLERVREVALGAMAHQDLPFDRLVEELQPERSLTHLPFTKLMFAYQSMAPESITFGSSRMQFRDVEPELSKFELTVTLRETSEGLLAVAEFSRELFDTETIVQFLAHFETLLRGIAAAPGRPISKIPLLSSAERHQLLVECNQTDTAYPRGQRIHELFETQVRRAPHATAATWDRSKISYRELNGRANQLARFLNQFSIQRDVPVALCVDRSLEMLIGMLGILKAGGAYVPIDSSYPKERLTFMLEDAGAPVLLTQERLLSRLPRTLAKVVCLDADWDLIAREKPENLSNVGSDSDLAYIMYTSGSTGQPKGVAIPHRAVNRLVLNTNYVQLDSKDRIAQVSNISFDAATFELWGALLNGAQVVGISSDVALSPKEFANELRERGISAMFLTTALFNQLAAEVPGAFESVGTVIAGGEALDPKWVREVLRNRPPKQLVNGYGPTENTTFTCCHLIREIPEHATLVPLGKPISNTTVYLLDSHLEPVPIGIPGELYAGGDGLARGYWNRPDLTSQKFIRNPFDESAKTCLYRTGDMARRRADGTIEFLGRIDGQIKIRGYRVELGEIETQLATHATVRECVVKVAGSSSTSKRLVAYVVAEGQATPTASQLRAFLMEKLPDYMIPSVFVNLGALPLTPNGKIDRAALPAPEKSRPSLDRRYVAAQDAIERQLVMIWQKVLTVQPIGIQDKFFDLGGHSMLAVRVIAQIEKAFGRKLRLATLFQAGTIQRLAAVLREEIDEVALTAGSSLVEVQSGGSSPPLFLVHGAGGGMFWGYVNLSRRLGMDQPMYGFKCPGLAGQRESGSLQDMAARYIADLRVVQPQGPYYLGGYCFGGNVAYEMACQLAEQGHEVALLALLNCAPPNSGYEKIPWTPAWSLRFARNLLHWIRYFSSWSVNQRRGFFRWKWHLLKRRLSSRRDLAGQLAKIEPGELVDLSAYTEEQKGIWEHHIRALLSFRPKPYRGRVHLFRSAGHPLWCSFDEDYGWGRLAQQGVELIRVPGAHEKILEEPWVGFLGQALSTALQSAQQQHSQNAPKPQLEQKVSAAEIDSGGQTLVPRAESPVSPLEMTYPRLFESRVSPFELRMAVRFESKELYYHDLSLQANQLAHYLRQLGVGPESLVGVVMDRSLDLAVALMGIMKSGGAYLPLDPDYPADRLTFMLQDARPTVLLTSSKLLRKLPSEHPRIVCLDDPAQQASIRACSQKDPGVALTPDNLAYVIYTSGSTGTPKGVEVTHRALVNHNLAILEAYRLTPADRVLQFTALSFDISVEEIFPTWLSGATLLLRTEAAISSVDRFLRYISQEAVTVLNLPTAYWHELVAFLHTSGRSFPESVRLVVIGGERASDSAFRHWKECAPASVALINGYGATEATITTTVYTASHQDSTLPIGKPIANTEAIVLDEDLMTVPAGSTGELYIGGAGLARGYLNRAELTAESFISNPFPELIRSERLYKTGDIVRARVDGNLEFVGRLDTQVKVRGYRIELGEVENALGVHPGIKEVAAMLREGESGNPRLVAYYVPRSLPGPGVSELRNLLKRTLPAYMIPSVVVPLQQMPLTPAGKIDRRSLPNPAKTRPKFDQNFVAPSSPLETLLSKTWSEVLEVEQIGVDDSFIELGGHSLLATKVLSRIRDACNVEIPLADFFAHPTISALARHVSSLAEAQNASAKANPIDGVHQPLSPKQERLWLLDQLDSNRSAYNRALVIQLFGPLRLDALKRSLRELANRHPALRAVYPVASGSPTQVISEPSGVELPMTDLSDLRPDDKKHQALQAAAKEAALPYIASQPLLRSHLLRLGDTEHWLIVTLNEIGADRHSVRLVLRELPILYGAAVQNQPAQLPPISPQDTARIAAYKTSETLQKEHLEYWSRQLADAPELLDLPSDRSRPAQGDYAGACFSFTVDPALSGAVGELAAKEHDQASGILLCAFATLLHRYTGSQDITVGSPISFRTAADPDVVANLESTVALRCRLGGNPTFRQLVRRLAEVRDESMAHAQVPFADVLKTIRPQISRSYTPVFQVLLSFEEEPWPQSTCADVRFIPIEIETQCSKFDITLSLTKQGQGWLAKFNYSTALFDRERISRMAEHFQEILRSATRNPDLLLSKLNLLPEPERKKLLVEWTATERNYPKEKTLADLIAARVQQNPDAEALVCGTARLTYAELFEKASRFGNRLHRAGVRKGALVGICLDRSAEMVVAILGTLLAGAAYVPLDPKYPTDRLAFTIEDAKIKLLVTQTKLLSLFPSLNSPPLCLDSLHNLRTEPGHLLEGREADPIDLAYVIYTSGSTGKPKGVALEHRNAVALVSWASQAFSAEELSGVLASTSICFDLSVFELFAPLCCGGKVILTDNALGLRGLHAAAEVRLINTVPSAIRELLRLKAIPAGVQVVNLAGEPLSSELVDQIYQETSTRKVFDLYGPTETTTYSTGVLRQRGQRATIGRPLPNEQIYLLDQEFQPVPIGVPGEIFIGGDGVAREYLGQPELTAQKFVAHPFKHTGRLYRTGDLGRWREDGNVEYLGRLDHQVKIRGYRIELGEIETVLKGHPGVTAAVVIAREDHPGDKRLVAYIESRGGVKVPVEDLKRRLGEQLPEFMTPSEFVFVDKMPMTPNGKIDRKALPAPNSQPSDTVRADLVSPRNTVEERLLAIWKDVLRLGQIGVNENFFDLGGHSLTAVRVISGVRDVFSVDLPLSAIFSRPTVEQLAKELSHLLVKEKDLRVAPIALTPRSADLPVSFVQERLWFLDQLRPGTAAYNVPAALRLKGPLDQVLLLSAVNQICSRHEALRANFWYKDGVLCQVISNRLNLDLPCIDLQNHPGAERELKAQELINQYARRPFDLAAGPLIRLTLFRLDSTDHVLLLVMHHTISDGWSLALFFQELAALYDAAVAKRPAPKLLTLPLQYPDFAHWQRQCMSGALLEEELAYWKRALEGAPAETALPLDHPRAEHNTGRASRRVALLESAAAKKITAFARREGCTPFMFFLAGLLITLRKWTAQEDLVIGTVVAGRSRSEFENLLGCFMNFLPLRARVREAQSAQELLANVRSVVLAGQTHQACPFEKIVAAAHPQRRQDQNPLYNVGLLLQNFPPNLFQSETLRSTSMPVPLEEALLDLRFEIEQTESGLTFACEYRTELFEPGTVENLLRSWLKINETLASFPERQIGQFELSSELRVAHHVQSVDPERPKIIVSATFTAEPIGETIEHWRNKLSLGFELGFAPFNQVFQQLLDPASLVARNPAGLNVILARLEDWQGGRRDDHGNSDNVGQDLETCAEEFQTAVRAAAQRALAPLLVCLCPPSPAALSDPTYSQCLSNVQKCIERELSGVTGVYVLAAEELARWYPVTDYHDAASEELGHVPYTPLLFAALGTAVVRKFHALNRAVYKVIALDCDNTLWAGVCGEDGPQGIQLDPPHRALQEFMRAQRESGMLLCLCSKNNEEDVRAVLNQRTDFPLQAQHYTATRLNWESKSDNLKSLASELGLGLDSFIFVDDNPIECAEVEANCSGVLALQLPEEAELIPQFLNHCWAFDHLRLTSEDRKRAELYQQNRMREKLRAEAPTLEQFLDGLQLKVQIEPIQKDDWQRVAQLTQRTNQFNVVTRRMTEQELADWLVSASVLVVRVSDRFGDYGLVGTVTYRIESDAVAVDNMLLSCRVLGRGIEHRILAHLGGLGLKSGAHWVDVHFVPTPKSQPALNFLESVGLPFKQPLNGGYLFRFPVAFAAQVAFHPSTQTGREKPSPRNQGNETASIALPRFAAGASCFRDIALSGNDVSKILTDLGSEVVRRRAHRDYIAPTSQLEQQLCGLWHDLLHVEPIGIRDDFFELGGHSLMAVRLFAEIQKLTGRKLPLVTLFRAPTVEHLAGLLSRSDTADTLLVPIQPHGSKPPLFLVHGAGGDVLWGYANLATHLPPDQPVFGIKSSSQREATEHLQLEQMAHDYLKAVRSRQSEGPYFLGGYCFGGNVAYEMARQLQLEGQEVELVVLIDTAPANAGYEQVAWWRPAFAWRFARNFRFWLADFLALEAQERRNFASRKLRWLGRKLLHRIGLGPRKARFDLEEVIDPRQFPEQELALWQVHLEALIAHVERPYTGRVALMRTRGQPLFCSLEEDFCWGKLVQGGVLVKEIPGSHENIFMGHNVQILAAELNKLLVANPDADTSMANVARAGSPTKSQSVSHL